MVVLRANRGRTVYRPGWLGSGRTTTVVNYKPSPPLSEVRVFEPSLKPLSFAVAESAKKVGDVKRILHTNKWQILECAYK